MSTKKLNAMTENEKALEKERFNHAEDSATFSPEVISIVLDVSLSWLQKKRCEGDGIPFSKVHYRKIMYKKSDVISFINQRNFNSTSQYRAA